MASICLNMIVKNEQQVLARCLNSLKPFLDYWVIVDTGSSDGTQELIKQLLADVPGELHQRPWHSFGHNRTEAIRLAEHKADYLLFCDADMYLEVDDAHWKQQLTQDAYLITQYQHNLRYDNTRLINARLTGSQRFRYWCPTHEYCAPIDHNHVYSRALCTGVRYRDCGDGGSKQDKFARDAALLEAEMAQYQQLKSLHNPRAAEQNSLAELEISHSRNLFYLAQTYKDMGNASKAYSLYSERAALGGWEEEAWYAQYMAAVLSETQAPTSALNNYLAAYERRPTRIEPLYQLARMCRERNQYAQAFLFAQAASHCPLPSEDILFVDAWVYQWRAKDEYAIASYWTQRYAESIQACEELLSEGFAPQDHRERIQKNQAAARKAIQAQNTLA